MGMGMGMGTCTGGNVKEAGMLQNNGCQSQGKCAAYAFYSALLAVALVRAA